jgi:hypothetical protein
MFQKAQNANKTKTSVISNEFRNNLTEFVSEYSSASAFNTNKSWVILNSIEQRIKEKVERIGTPLKEWDIKIYRGILTGYNEAFIINGKKKDELIKQDPKSAEIIRPILRGRDIRRYQYIFADLHLIATFPSKNYDIEEYPAVKRHLLSFGYERLKQTGEPGARKKTNNKWFETQDSINYWEDFSKQKIVWGEISDKTKFCLDMNGDFVCEATTFLMTGASLLALLCYLNSSLSEYLFAQIGTTTGVGTVRWKKFTIEQLKIPNDLFLKENEAFETIGNQIILQKRNGKDVFALEKEIDKLIYEAFDFTVEEIKAIERN